jgi:putative transposase
LSGGTYFLTVNLRQHYPNDLLVRLIDILRNVVRVVRQKRPLVIDGWVILPDLLQCVWTLPLGDDDLTNHWRLIIQDFSKALPIPERRSAVRLWAVADAVSDNAVSSDMLRTGLETWYSK